MLLIIVIRDQFTKHHEVPIVMKKMNFDQICINKFDRSFTIG